MELIKFINKNFNLLLTLLLVGELLVPEKYKLWYHRIGICIMGLIFAFTTWYISQNN